MLLKEAENFYRVKLQNNTWGELSKDKQELMVMKATFKDMNLKLVEANKKIKGLKNSQKEEKGGADQKLRNIPKWKLENANNKKKLKRQGKTYYWYERHNNDKGMWFLNNPSTCPNRP